MLAVFGQQRPELPRPSAKRKAETTILPEEEEYVNEIFNQLYESLPKRQRGFVQEHLPSGGANGFAWADSLTIHMVTAGPFCCLFMGTLLNNPTNLEDGEYILNEYQDACGGSALELASEGGPSLDICVQLEGPFAFIIHDRVHGRVMAARDGDGAQPLFWGTCPRNGALLFASDKSLMSSDCEGVAEFPAGAVFVSQDGSTQGTIATIGATTLLHPDLCRVESANNFSKIRRKTPSTNRLTAT